MMSAKPIAALSLGVVLFVGLSVNARAAMNVGDAPTLEFKPVDGTPVSLEKLKGKIAVVDFWATWCPPCMAEAGHMVELRQEVIDGFPGTSFAAQAPKALAALPAE